MNPANYLLIDGVLRPDTIRTLYQRGEPLVIKPLYLGTRWAPLKEQGPILVRVNAPSKLIHEWRASPRKNTDACAFYSQAPVQAVADHLRRFLSPSDHLGQCSLLRFADPVVLHYWLSSYSFEHLAQILGPIEQLWVHPPTHSWQPQAPAFGSFMRDGPIRPWNPQFALLGEPQLAALDQAYRWVFQQRLYNWLNELDPKTFSRKTVAQIDSWLAHALDSGYQWGLVSEYGLATWMELCQLWGLDFIDHLDGPYQRWVTDHPEQARLAPELRIQALDDFRFNILAKEN